MHARLAIGSIPGLLPVLAIKKDIGIDTGGKRVHMP